MNFAAMRQQLERHEGLRLKPYLDCCGKPWRQCACTVKGKLTIGIGRNLDDEGITEDEAQTLLGNDIVSTEKQLLRALPWYIGLDEARQRVLVDMAFNLGVTGLLQFKHMLAATAAHDFNAAAEHMEHSTWATQVGSRATELVALMKVGST